MLHACHKKYVYCTIFFFVCKLILILQFTRHVRKPFTFGLCCKYEKSHRHITCGSLILMCPKGFEPPTHGLEGRCSIQLSYGHIFIKITEVLCNRSAINSPSRARTYNNSVNSRVLYHWAIEDYAKGFVYTFKTDTEPFLHLLFQVKLPVD